MELEFKKEKYNINNYPSEGRHILAQTHNDLIVVYQAYKKSIADYAVKNQQMGGSEFSFNRMSWIKPNFLWMMFRSGWAQKENQNRVLAFWIKQKFFDEILQQSVASTYNKFVYATIDDWKADLERSEVRLQWDPDHDPFGEPVERRAVQLGLRGTMLKAFGTVQAEHIEDVTPFVFEQYEHVKHGQLEKLMVPLERIYKPHAETICKRIGLD
jgi:hypothetical protein